MEFSEKNDAKKTGNDLSEVIIGDGTKKEYHHYYNEDTVDESFLRCVNEEIEHAIISIRLGKFYEVPKYIKVTDLNKTSIKAISDFVGFDISGYKCVVERDRLMHMEERHGINGKQDKSLSDPKDAARMGWAINNISALEWQLDENGNIKNMTKNTIIKTTQVVLLSLYVLK